MVEEVKAAARLADLTERLKAYKTSLAFSYSFLIWASVMIGLPLLHTAIMFSPWFSAIRPYHPWAFFITVGIAVALSLALMFYLLNRLGITGLPTPKIAAAAWSLSFSIPFALIYNLLPVLGLWELMPVAWILSGGIAFTAIGLTIERILVRERLMFARPFLLMGLLSLVFSVPVFYLALQAQPCDYVVNGAVVWSWSAGPLSAMLLASALDMLASFIASFYTLLTAERAVFGP